jgi:hypothetical protein
MKQKDRSLLYLLTFTMLLFSFSSIFAAVTVTYVNKALPYNSAGQTIEATVVTTVDIYTFDLVTKVTSGIPAAFGEVSVLPGITVVATPPNPQEPLWGWDWTTNVGAGSPDLTRVWGWSLDPSVIMMPAGTYNFTFTVKTTCAVGTFTLGDGEWPIDPLGMTLATTGFVNGATAFEPLVINPGTYTVVNETPVITNCPGSFELDACATYSLDFNATDADEAHICASQNLTWSIVPAVSGASINPVTGEFLYVPGIGAAALGPKAINVRVTDEFLATANCAFTITVVNDAPVITACPDDFNLDACLVYNYVFAATDDNACGTNLTWSVVNKPPPTEATTTIAAGPALTAAFSFDPLVDPTALGPKSITVRVTDQFDAYAECEVIINVFNTTPVFVDCPPVPALEMFGCTTLEHTFLANDANKCVALVYSLVGTVPTGASIVGATGVFTYNPPDALASGLQNFTVRATDEFGFFAECAFTVLVKADAPVFTVCPDPDAANPVVWGEIFDGFVTATDADAGPLALEYTLVDFSGPVTAGPFFVNSTTGAFSWPTEYGNTEYSGVHQVSIKVSDGCKEAICNFDIHLTGMYAEIGKMHNVLQGRYAFDSVYLHVDGIQLGGLDLLIAYDASALTLHEVIRGPELALWEYFTYRFGATGNCNGACPSGLVKIVGIADMNNGAAHPLESAYDVDGLVAILKFLVTSNRTYDCQFVPVAFYWTDCTDNVLSSPDGVTAYISHYVWWYTGDFPPSDVIRLDNNPHHDVWPGYGGWGSILEPDCLTGYNQKVPPLDWVDFYDGGIDIVCADSIDKRGDLNLNGIANEIADAVIYTQYFLIGIDAFPILVGFPDSRQAAIAASDVNADGSPLTIGDLVYMLRVVTGDALSYPKSSPFAQDVSVHFDGKSVATESNVNIGAVLLTFRVGDNYRITNLTNLTLAQNQKADELKVLLYDISTKSIGSGLCELVRIDGGQVELVAAEAADYNGNMLISKLKQAKLPTTFALGQNYPNPFNPETVIEFALPTAGEVSLRIYNAAGQLVRTLVSGSTPAGYHQIRWDGCDANGSGVSSGVYFYKIDAKDFSETRKMLLVK